MTVTSWQPEPQVLPCSARTPSRKQTILRAIFPFTDVPAYDLPVYASQCHTGHHARLGTQLPAKLCRGHHFRQLNFKSFQGATPHGSVRALVSAYGSYLG